MTRNLLTAAFIFFSTAAAAQESYKAGIDQWHRQRIENLKTETGWLNLVGLYWLQPGKNSFGTGNVQVKFPTGTIGANAGHFERNGTTVVLHTNAPNTVKVNGSFKNDAIIFSTDSAAPAVCSYGNLRWTIIKREEKIGIRLRDLGSKQLKNFKGIARFAVDSNYKVTATLQKNASDATVLITNVLGQTTALRSPGKLLFTLGGKEYTLDALEEGNELFIIFTDATSGDETYPSGRFLYAAKPAANSNTTVLDFNKAYNPPCAFTPYATCPLPPKQNFLPVAVKAGEKNYGHH